MPGPRDIWPGKETRGNMSYQIAIDGPAGAGKSTIAKMVAAKLKFIYVDTGAMYRALALFCLNENIDVKDEDKVTDLCKKADIKLSYEDNEQVILLNGTNVNKEIRTPKVGDTASVISAYKEVRKKLVSLQQEIAENSNVIMDGRDIASKVLPNANLKVYLDADVHVRAVRRVLELKEKGMDESLEEIEAQMRDRDYRDMHRENSPLVCVEDAKKIDSSNMTQEEVTDEIIKLFKEAVNE